MGSRWFSVLRNQLITCLKIPLKFENRKKPTALFLFVQYDISITKCYKSIINVQVLLLENICKSNSEINFSFFFTLMELRVIFLFHHTNVFFQEVEYRFHLAKSKQPHL